MRMAVFLRAASRCSEKRSFCRTGCRFTNPHRELSLVARVVADRTYIFGLFQLTYAINHGRSSNPLLRRQDRDLLGPHDRRRVPFASQRFGLRSIEAHAKVEGPFGGGKPIGLLFCTRALVLKIKVERTVRTVLEWHPAADGETVQAVSDLKAVLVVEGDRPESVHRRDGRFVEVDRVLVRTVERFARFVAKVQWVNRILGQVRAEA